MSAWETLSSHYGLYTFPESTSLLSIKMFTKHQISSVIEPLSLSLKFFCSSLTDYQAQRKVLAFSQAILVNRAFPLHVHKDRFFCLPNLSRSANHLPPKLSFLPKTRLHDLYLATNCPFLTLRPQLLLTS
jgi:hypothetical protein